MDDNTVWYMNEKVRRTIEELNKNNMEGYYVKNKEELLQKIKEFVKEGSTVSVGGSMTLFEMGIIDFLRDGKYNFLDRYRAGLTPEDIKEIYRKSFFADTYFTSTNAITEKGELYNIDGTGNRVAAMLYGPNQVIVVVGVNKIVKDLEAAENRVKNCAAPINAKRLDRKTPCTTLGYCVDCKSEERICNDYVVIKRQGIIGRIKVIIISQQCGY